MNETVGRAYLGIMQNWRSDQNKEKNIEWSFNETDASFMTVLIKFTTNLMDSLPPFTKFLKLIQILTVSSVRFRYSFQYLKFKFSKLKIKINKPNSTYRWCGRAHLELAGSAA